jgi:hypothetical protein
VNKGGEHSLLVYQMVVRAGIQIEVGVSGLSVYPMSQGAVRSNENISIQEGDAAICLSFHGVLYVGMDAVTVEEETVHIFLSMRPDQEGVIHVCEPAERLVGSPFECLFFESSINKMAITGDRGKPMTNLSVCSENYPLEQKMRTSGHGKKKSEVVLIKVSV